MGLSRQPFLPVGASSASTMHPLLVPAVLLCYPMRFGSLDTAPTTTMAPALTRPSKYMAAAPSAMAASRSHPLVDPRGGLGSDTSGVVDYRSGLMNALQRSPIGQPLQGKSKDYCDSAAQANDFMRLRTPENTICDPLSTGSKTYCDTTPLRNLMLDVVSNSLSEHHGVTPPPLEEIQD